MENGVLFFYFTVPVTELLKIEVCCFLNIVASPKQRPDHSGVRHIVCITRTLKVPSGR